MMRAAYTRRIVAIEEESRRRCAGICTRSQKGGKSPLERLSGREREILQLVVEGKTSAAIAAYLGLSPKSVETYRSRLMGKLGVQNVPQLVKFALQHVLTPPTR